MTILDRGIFIVVAAFLFVLLMYVIRLLKKLINTANNMSNRLNFLETSNNKNIPVTDYNKSLTRDEFARLSGYKIIETISFISMSFISIYFIDTIPNIINRNVLNITFKESLFILKDIVGFFIILLLLWSGFAIHDRIIVLQDKSRKIRISIQNIFCGFCIYSSIFANVVVLIFIIYEDLTTRTFNYVTSFCVLSALIAIFFMAFITRKPHK